MKKGIQVQIPGFGAFDIRTVVTDFTGTHSRFGVLTKGVRERLQKLSEVVDIIVLTSDTFGTCAKQMAGLDLRVEILPSDKADRAKQVFVNELGPATVAAFGNGRNDRLMLKAVKKAGGLAVAVDNGEGCATEALFSSHIFVHGSTMALDLLLVPDALKATLRA
jgi:soluble P-type ATPase